MEKLVTEQELRAFLHQITQFANSGRIEWKPAKDGMYLLKAPKNAFEGYWKISRLQA